MPIKDLRYVAEYLDGALHDSLLAAADDNPWQRSAGRGVQVYGYRYHHPTTTVFRIGELPSWAADVAARLWRDGLLSSMPNQLVVNDYEAGSGIFAHVDQPAFGDEVASISLGSACVMQFSRTSSEVPIEMLLEPRSVLVLAGEARWEWHHGIAARLVDHWHERELPRGRRVSLTFRIIAASMPCRICKARLG